MKRWTLMIVAMAAALALIATPALAATQAQTQSQEQYKDGPCADCTAECYQLQLRSGEASQAGEPVRAMTQTKTQAGEPVQAQTKTQAGEPVQAMTQAGEQIQAHTPEWAEKLARHQNQHAKKYAKRVKAIASSD